MKCVNCKFWTRRKKEGMTDFGFCHRFPPQVFFDSTNQYEISVLPTIHQDEFCGEFKQKENP